MTLHIEFTGTRGGTNISCEVDHEASELGGTETGEPILLVSQVKGLNSHPVRLHARLDMKTLIGACGTQVSPCHAPIAPCIIGAPGLVVA